MPAIKTCAALRSFGATRLDLLLEMLALHHQLGVLARCHQRFLRVSLANIGSSQNHRIRLSPRTAVHAVATAAFDAGYASVEHVREEPRTVRACERFLCRRDRAVPHPLRVRGS